MRITSKGQVAGAGVRIVTAGAGAPRRPTRGEEMVRRLRGTGEGEMTTDDIMRLMRGDD